MKPVYLVVAKSSNLSKLNLRGLARYNTRKEARESKKIFKSLGKPYKIVQVKLDAKVVR